ncbi:MAG: tetratricopeptide repeat protein [bacterium]
MKGLKNLLIFVVVVVIILVLIPPGIRNGYFNYYLGKYYEMTGDTGNAANYFEEAHKELPESPTFVAAWARVLNDLGVMNGKKEYYDRADEAAHDWLEEHGKETKSYVVWIEQSRAEWGQERKLNAKQSIDSAIDLMPTSYNALVYQGIIIRDMNPKNREGARQSIPVFEQAIEVKNHMRTAWAQYELAVAWDIVGNEGKALNALEQALSQYPPRDLRDKSELLKNKISSGGRSEK